MQQRTKKSMQSVCYVHPTWDAAGKFFISNQEWAEGARPAGHFHSSLSPVLLHVFLYLGMVISVPALLQPMLVCEAYLLRAFLLIKGCLTWIETKTTFSWKIDPFLIQHANNNSFSSLTFQFALPPLLSQDPHPHHHDLRFPLQKGNRPPNKINPTWHNKIP